MKILSINISEPTKTIFNGKELITSIFKKPVEGEVEITDMGITGDTQADLKVHGGYDKAIYAYSHKHYKMWSDELDKNFQDYGLVGENLTVDDFDEKNICIGDKIRISNCLVQVTQPRIPCYKLGIKMNDRGFPKLFSQSCYVGGYLRVLDVGKISREDELKIVKKEPNSLSLFDMANLIFKDINNVKKMKQALDIAPLTEEIKEKFRERLMKLGDFGSL